jgi:hypothetical protein
LCFQILNVILKQTLGTKTEKLKNYHGMTPANEEDNEKPRICLSEESNVDGYPSQPEE